MRELKAKTILVGICLLGMMLMGGFLGLIVQHMPDTAFLGGVALVAAISCMFLIGTLMVAIMFILSDSKRELEGNGVVIFILKFFNL